MKKYPVILAFVFIAAMSTANAQEYAFSQNLSVGATGSEVVALQSWLIANGYDIPAISSGLAAKGYFGIQTRVALIRFQNSTGLPATGFFGPLTRGKIRDRGIVYNPGAPVINGVDAPTSLVPLQTGTWSVRATDPQNGTLSYSVDWGDAVSCPSGYSCTAPGIASQASSQQSAAFTHSYVNAGTYFVKFTVTNSAGLRAQSSVTVQVGPGSSSSLNIISPNGGESWQRGTTQTIRWTSPTYFRATYADIKLVPYYPPCTGQVCPMAGQTSIAYPYQSPYTIAEKININQNSYIWNVGAFISPPCPPSYACAERYLADGQYTIQICETGTNNCDSSDRPFTLFTDFSPQVLSPNGGEVWQANSAQTIRWSIPTTASANGLVDLYLDPVYPVCTTSPCPMTAMMYRAPYTLDKNISVNTSYGWLVATDINNVAIPAGDYTVRICTAGSSTSCDSSDRAFTITRQ